jgi:type II secretory pathway pseudopilin PulG
MEDPQRQEAVSGLEVGVLIVLLGILAFLAAPAAQGTSLVKGQETQMLSNMRQLHLATQTMALDTETTGENCGGWPGDLGGSYYLWARMMVPSYLSTNDFCKLLSARGKVVPPGKIPYSTFDSGVLVYAVRSNSPAFDVFLTSANFTNTPHGGTPLDKKGLPYGDKGFVVFRKAGDGAVLSSRQVGHTNLIGTYAPLCR